MYPNTDTHGDHDMNSGHGGNVSELVRLSSFKGKKLIDFSSNINPLGPPEWLRDVISAWVPGCPLQGPEHVAQFLCDA